MSSTIVLPSACCFLGILVFLLQTDTAFLLHLSQCPQAPVKKLRHSEMSLQLIVAYELITLQTYHFYFLIKGLSGTCRHIQFSFHYRKKEFHFPLKNSTSTCILNIVFTKFKQQNSCAFKFLFLPFYSMVIISEK